MSHWYQWCQKYSTMFFKGDTLYSLALFPGPRCFRLHEERGGPGIFSHMCNIKGRKDLIECGHTGDQNSKKSLPHVSNWRGVTVYTHQMLNF